MTPRRLLLAGAVLTALGLAVAMTSPHAASAGGGHREVQQQLGGIVVLVGWATLGWGIHRFGRTG